MIALSLGFLAMLIARSGYYKSDDYLKNFFVIFLFATIGDYSKIGFSCFISSNFQQWFLACIATLGVSFAWRKWLSYLYFKIINAWGISNENERGSVLNTIIQDTNIHINGLKVYTRDGKCYSCSHFGWVREKIYKEAQFLIDDTGVLMPVTDISYPKTSDFKDVSGVGYLTIQGVGISHTYIPISEIKSIDFIVSNK